MAAKVKTDLVGCDLEYAVVQEDDRYIPAGMLPINGVKGHPEMFPTGGIEIDCTAVELTFPPADNEDSFVKNILSHLSFAREKYKEFGRLVTKPSVFFEESVLKRVRFASEMGCSPDFNAWTGHQNPLPVPHANIRAYGGHVHIENGNVDTIRACDLTLGMWSVLRDSDTDRRKMYGKAGAFRPKQYGNSRGVEYRVLSSFWCDSEHYIRQVWRLTETAKTLAPKINKLVYTLGGAQEIQSIINQNQRMKARSILKTIGFDDGAI